jgi:hypothetical protein
MCRGMNWILGLLTTYTHHSELHVITALSLIYTLQFTVTHTLGFSVFTSSKLATDFNTVKYQSHYEKFLRKYSPPSSTQILRN